MNRTQPGGAATIGGVVYQLLWMLLELTTIELRDPEHDDTGALTGAVLVVEPAGGGGDARIQGESVHIVTQLKTRSGDGTWSLQAIIKGVLPDLLKGVRLEAAAPEYRFVTDGRIGSWKTVQRFFRSLRGLDDAAVASLLAAPDLLQVGAKAGAPPNDGTSFWTKASYTRRELVDKIVSSLSEGQTVQDRAEFEKRVLHLLAHFEFCEPLTVADAEARIDAALGEKTDYVEDVPSTRKRLLQELAEIARSGSVPIHLGTFLSKAGLDALPAHHNGAIVVQGRKILSQRLRTLRFRPEQHVQEDFTATLARSVREWPVVLVTGESGAGKSWHCCAVADLLARQGAIVSHIEAEPTASATLDRAMGVLWNSVKGNDKVLPYDRAAMRLHGPPPPRVLVIDRVEDARLARDLAVADCEMVKLRLVLGCTPEAADAAKDVVPEKCQRVEVERFTPTELNDYLAARGVPHWEAIPLDVRAVLQTPLMARVYCDTVTDTPWRPTNEYELYDHYWQSRLGPGTRIDPTLDIALLRALARDFIAGNPYPWSADRMHSLVKHEGSFHRLRRSGIVTVRTDGSCEVWHDRLLNWLVASTVVEDVANGQLTPEDIGALCARAMNGSLGPRGKPLGYVPMDALWHLAGRRNHNAAAAVLTALEASTSSELYSELIPTLGPRAVPMLLERLDQLLMAEPSYTTTDVANCLARIESPEAIAKARTLLASESRHARAVALAILRQQGDPESLNRIWDLHAAATGEEARGVEYERRMDALAAAIRIRPRWLIERLERAELSTAALPDLVYQLARLPGGKADWLALKQHLKAIVPADRRRSVIRCIYVFRDREELEFLRAETSSQADLAGDMALAALTRLDPDAAAADLASSNLKQIIFTRGWHFHPLLAARPVAAHRAIRELVRRRGETWALSEMYSGAENAIDLESFELVLDHIVSVLQRELASARPDPNSGALHGPLTFVERIVMPELVAALRARQGSDLPRLLGEYLLAIAPRDDISARLTDTLALRVLQRIGDPALTEWVKAGLRAPSRFGRYDALRDAHMHADPAVIELLRRIAFERNDNDGRFESYLAVHALTQLNAWEAVVEVVVAAGLNVSPYPFDERREELPLEGDYVETLLQRIQSESPTPGLLLASGLTRDDRFREPVMAAALNDNASSDILLSATIAAELLQVDDRAVHSLARRLEDPNVSDRLAAMVLGFGTEAALTAVEQLLRKRFDPALCAALAEHDGWETRAAVLAWERRAEAERSVGFELVLPLFARVDDERAKRYLEMLAFGEGRTPFGQSLRFRATEALRTIDASRAYEAALGATRDTSERHRNQFPALLVELDGARAVPHLLEMLRVRDAEDFELAIADAVAQCDLSSQVEALLQSGDAAARRAGCILAARRSASDIATRLLRDRAVDVDEAVSDAAIFALGEGLRAEGVLELAREAARETGTRRWTITDHLISLARATKDAPQVRSAALAPLCARLRPLEAYRANESLRKGEKDFDRTVKDRTRRLGAR
jgi:hypothetical protein